ncbi:MAG: hypothetical protein J0H51_20810 [Rhizobiales bacterium]|nr:hypothetical protein [Hyphomicrobiales bacterium]
MTVIPCQQNKGLKEQIERFAEVLKTEAHRLGDHGLEERDFYNSGLFRGAIERVRGQFSATTSSKREFVQHVLNHMQDRGFISDWDRTEGANRNDYRVRLPNNRVAVIDLKGCLDGNNTNIFERPSDADEFIIWSVCTNIGANPRRNAWSGIHTRLSAEVIARNQRVDGVVIWDMVCGTLGRPCPKLADATRMTDIGPFRTPPPCIYVFPSHVPNQANPSVLARQLADVGMLDAFHQCFLGQDSEVNFVDFDIEMTGNEILRRTAIRRASAVQQESEMTPIRRV